MIWIARCRVDRVHAFERRSPGDCWLAPNATVGQARDLESLKRSCPRVSENDAGLTIKITPIRCLRRLGAPTLLAMIAATTSCCRCAPTSRVSSSREPRRVREMPFDRRLAPVVPSRRCSPSASCSSAGGALERRWPIVLPSRRNSVLGQSPRWLMPSLDLRVWPCRRDSMLTACWRRAGDVSRASIQPTLCAVDVARSSRGRLQRSRSPNSRCRSYSSSDCRSRACGEELPWFDEARVMFTAMLQTPRYEVGERARFADAVIDAPSCPGERRRCHVASAPVAARSGRSRSMVNPGRRNRSSWSPAIR